MLEFTKMQGLGNDYIYIDAINQKVENREKLAKKLSDRHFGIGSDGLILIEKSKKADFKMSIYNKDGSKAEMCGNGIRCVGKYVYDKGLTTKTNLKIETKAGIKLLELKIEKGKVKTVKVDMKKPIIEKKIKLKIEDKEFILTCVSMGNPHAVIILGKDEKLEELEIEKYGKQIEENPIFPNKTNVEFVKVKDTNHIKMRVWERGTGETLACGTGACATAVACNIEGLTKNAVTVELLGGNLEIEWNKENNHVYMTGEAKSVFEGKWEEQ